MLSKREPRPEHLNIRITQDLKTSLEELADLKEKTVSRVAYEILRDEVEVRLER